jgi:predicted Zn-dependent peptidase
MPVSTEVREFVLDNGLSIWLNEDHNQPKVFGAVVVKAGSKDCPNTGIAHYFEHIMFKGTENIGTVDYAAEKVFLDRIAEKYDLLAKTKDDLLRLELQKEINELSVLAADYAIPNEFDKLISRYGGSNTNAGTSYDYTLYHNIFSPQYIEQWAEINSERFISPVFRMFQTELETVYEEKIRTDDMMFNQAMERAFKIFFQPHPYAYPVIGSAENLKTPRLSDMKRFFENYYVANNMGVLLSGDFESGRVLPILRRAFGRLPHKELPERYRINLPPFMGREKYSVKIPIPVMKVMAMAFRGVPANHPDLAGLNIALSMLNNANGTGYLDRLMRERKLISAMAGGETLNEAGMLGFIILPRPVIQTYGMAERMIWREIERIKSGDFTDEMFESLKMEQLRKDITALEDIDSRCRVMVRLMTQGKTWDDYLRELRRAEELTRDDVVKIAKEYFIRHYMVVRKRTGKYPKEYLPKPNLAPVKPKHRNAESKYAKKLEQLPVQEVRPRFLDFKRDAERVELAKLVTLYAVRNPVNTVFTLKMSFCIGTLEEPRLKLLAGYLPLLGTGRLTAGALRTEMQRLGAEMHFEAKDNYFNIILTGFDKYLEKAVALAGEFIRRVRPDERKIKTLRDDARLSRKAVFKSSSMVAEALFEYIRYGKDSQYLRQAAPRDIRRVGGSELLELFAAVRRVKCNYHYCGRAETAVVAQAVMQHLPLESVISDTRIPIYREAIDYNRPLIFAYSMSNLSQTILCGYNAGRPLPSPDERALARLFSEYFGGGISSILSQEIREFRSFAYQTSAGVELPPYCHSDRPAPFLTYLSTQADKTADALTVLEALIRRMPADPDRLQAAALSITSQVNNEYPPFRELSTHIARYRQLGFEADPNIYLLARVSTLSLPDVLSFHDERIRNANMVYTLVGNLSKINTSRLTNFGDLIRVHRSDFYH